ncbi:transposable element Tc1 transposase [Trichonephila clavipes]|nr:transposable element Tc1 transposase [Trichonephila clavipes]
MSYWTRFFYGNEWPHQTANVRQRLESEEITRMHLQSFSPDLNPIEHVWAALMRRILARLDPLGNSQPLKQMLIEEWVSIPQELHNLLLSIKRRCEVTIAVREEHILACTSSWTCNHMQRPQFYLDSCDVGLFGVLHSALWHGGDWLVDGIREAWQTGFIRMGDVIFFFGMAESLEAAL